MDSSDDYHHKELVIDLCDGSQHNSQYESADEDNCGDSGGVVATTGRAINGSNAGDMAEDMAPKREKTFDELVSNLQSLLDDCGTYLSESTAFESGLTRRLDLLIEEAVEVKASCGSDAKALCDHMKQFSEFVDNMDTNSKN